MSIIGFPSGPTTVPPEGPPFSPGTLVTTTCDLQLAVADELRREDLTNRIIIWLHRAHREIQMLRNWEVQETMQRTLAAGITWTLPLPADFKTPWMPIFRVMGADLFSPLIPRFFYERRGMVDVLDARLRTFPLNQPAILVALDAALEAPTYDIFFDHIEIRPKNEETSDQFVFPYYRMLPLPDGCGSTTNNHDWFTDFATDYLIYEALRFSHPFLDADDKRIQIWSTLRSEGLSKVMGLGVAKDTDGAALQMRG